MTKSMKDLQEEIATLKCQLKAKEEELYKLSMKKEDVGCKYGLQLSPSDICRYSRQMLVPSIDVDGQISLSKSKVLIVGAGGLGCPSAMYLAAGGVGEITIVDNDQVELTNLHRQVLHMQSDIGLLKVDSVAEKLLRMNSHIKVTPLYLHVDRNTIGSILKDNNYNVVVDCTDNVATRYLLNDACVMYKIPLVSGSALQLEGQLTVYNYEGGPCYRCLFPKPPPAETVTSCGDGGIVGPVCGTIGTLQALEAMKIITNIKGVLSQRLLLFDGAETTFRNVKLRPRNVNCAVCGDNPTIKVLIDYEQFCGSKANDKVENIDILSTNEHVHVKDLFANNMDKIIIDVRPPIEYRMCRLPDTINVPYEDIVKGKRVQELEEFLQNKKSSCVYVLCRRGNNSQRAAVYLKKKFSNVNFINVSGGLYSYSKYVDKEFPVY